MELSEASLASLTKLLTSSLLFCSLIACAVLSARRVAESRRVRGVVARLEGDGSCTSFERFLVFVTYGEVLSKRDTSRETKTGSDGGALHFAGCLAGLVGCFLVWGVLQERMMTRTYDGEVFGCSSALVFSTKAVGALAGLILWAPWASDRRASCSRKPLAFVAFASVAMSNTLSSWAQLEALKFVSFPTQVLAKASKLVPALAVGRLVNGAVAPWREYGVAIVMTFGTATFMLAQPKKRGSASNSDDVGGLLMLAAYLLSDSLTGPLQQHFYRHHGVDRYALMFGVGFFSTLLSGLELAHSGDFRTAVDFFARHPDATPDLFSLALASTAGQIFIYTTLEVYGHVTLTVMMILRQIIAILLSCYRFGHDINAQGWLGVFVVFSATAYRALARPKQPERHAPPRPVPARTPNRRTPRRGAPPSDDHVDTPEPSGKAHAKVQ